MFIKIVNPKTRREIFNSYHHLFFSYFYLNINFIQPRLGVKKKKRKKKKLKFSFKRLL